MMKVNFTVPRNQHKEKAMVIIRVRVNFGRIQIIKLGFNVFLKDVCTCMYVYMRSTMADWLNSHAGAAKSLNSFSL